MSIDGPGSDVDSFEEWISQLAESKGVPEEEIVHQMMSSYWVLDELTGMMAEQSEGGPAFDRSSRGRTETAEASRQPDGDAESSDITIDRELLESLGNFIRLVTEKEGPVGTDERDASRRRRESDGAIDRIRELREGLERIEARLDKQASEQRADELSDRLDAVEEATSRRVDALESRVDGVDDIDERVGELEEGLERIEARLDKQAQSSERRSGELSARLDTVEEEATERIDALESRVEGDLDSVEEILKYLLESLTDIEDRTDSLSRARSEIEPLVAEHVDRQRLHEIKETANRRGAQTARCGVCDNPVDIGLLSKPECPHCDRPFEDLISRSWLWKTKHVLNTGKWNANRGPLPTESQEDEDTVTGASEGGSPANRADRTPSKDSTRGFDWIDDS